MLKVSDIIRKFLYFKKFSIFLVKSVSNLFLCALLQNRFIVNFRWSICCDYVLRPVENGVSAQIFTKLDLLRIEWNSEKVENGKNYKLIKNSHKFMTVCNITNMSSACNPWN